MDEDLFKELEKFHLSSYEIKAYSYLLMNGPAKATDIIRETGIPQPRIYDILGKLQKRGIVLVNSSLNKTYEAVMPKEAFKEDLLSMEKYISQLNEFVTYNKRKVAIKTPNIWFIGNDARIEKKLEESIEESKTEIIISLPGERILSVFPSLKKAFKNDVTICAVLGNDVGSEIINTLSKIAVVRTRDVTPAEIVIIDQRTAFLNAKSINDTSDYSIFIEEDELVDVMSYYYFYMNWLPAKFEIDFSRYRKFRISNSWLACEAIDNISGKGKKIRSEVKGFYKNKEITIEGNVTSNIRVPGIKQSFIVETKDGQLSVGGKNGKLEDIRMIRVIFEVRE